MSSGFARECARFGGLAALASVAAACVSSNVDVAASKERARNRVEPIAAAAQVRPDPADFPSPGSTRDEAAQSTRSFEWPNGVRADAWVFATPRLSLEADHPGYSKGVPSRAVAWKIVFTYGGEHLGDSSGIDFVECDSLKAILRGGGPLELATARSHSAGSSKPDVTYSLRIQPSVKVPDWAHVANGEDISFGLTIEDDVATED